MVILKYILIYFFYSAAGWAIESTYRSIGERRLLNSGFLTGPMCPIYGTAALVMTLCLYNPFYDRPLLVFVLGMVICDAVEYLTSLIMEILFNQHWWNYKYEFINIRGRICLKHTFFWGAASIGFTYIIHPSVDKVINGFSDKTVIILICCIFAVFIVDVGHSFIKALDVRAMQTKFFALKEKISEPISGLIVKVDDARTTISQKLDEENSKINESRQELYDQAEKLIASFEEKLGIKKRSDKKKAVPDRLYTNNIIKRNADKELEWLKRLRDEIKNGYPDDKNE